MNTEYKASESQAGCIKEALEYFNSDNEKGGLFVIQAGAGAGKTSTMINIIINLLKQNVSKNDIKMFSFTRASALDIRMKIRKEMQKIQDNKKDFNQEIIYVDTVHAFANSLLKQLSPLLSTIKEPNEIYKFHESESKGKILRENFSSFSTHLPDDIISRFIQIMKNNFVMNFTFGNELSNININSSKNILLKDKVMALKGRDRDIEARTDDIIVSTISALQDILYYTSDTFIRDSYIGKYLIFDECQDLDLSQILMIYSLSMLGCRIIVIGDKLQSLYRFRVGIGALFFDNITQKDLSKLLNIDYMETQYKLFDNFRSEASIINIQNMFPLYYKNFSQDIFNNIKEYLIKKEHVNITLLENIIKDCNNNLTDKEVQHRYERIVKCDNSKQNISLIQSYRNKSKKKEHDNINDDFDILNDYQDEPDDYSTLQINENKLISIKKNIKFDNKIVLKSGWLTRQYLINKDYANVNFNDIQKQNNDKIINFDLKKSLENMFINVANGYSASILMEKWPDSSDIINIYNFIREPLVKKLIEEGKEELSKKVSSVSINVNNGFAMPISESHVFPHYYNDTYREDVGIPISSMCLMSVISAFCGSHIYKDNKWIKIDMNFFSFTKKINGENIIDVAKDYFEGYACDTIRFIMKKFNLELSSQQKNLLIKIIVNFMDSVYNQYFLNCHYKLKKNGLMYNINKILHATQKNGYNPDDFASILTQILISIQNTNIFSEHTIEEIDNIRNIFENSKIIFDYPEGYSLNYTFNNRLKNVLNFIECNSNESVTSLNLEIIKNGLFGIDKFTSEMLGHLFKNFVNLLEENRDSINSTVRLLKLESKYDKQELTLEQVNYKIISTVFNRLCNNRNNEATSIQSLFCKYKKPFNNNEIIKEPNDNVILLSTIHGSKGLEWDHVLIFIPIHNQQALNKGINSYSKVLDFVGETFDDINKMYVALSRAKKQLDIVISDYHEQDFKQKLNKETIYIPQSQWIMGKVIYNLFNEMYGKENINKTSKLLIHQIKDNSKEYVLTTSSSEMEKSSCKNALLRFTKLPISNVSLNPKPSFEQNFHKLMASICSIISNIAINISEESNIDEIIAYKIAKFYNIKHDNIKEDVEKWSQDEELIQASIIWGRTITPPKYRSNFIDDTGKKKRADNELLIGQYYGKVIIEHIKNMIITMYGTEMDLFQNLKKINERNDFNNIWIEKELQHFYPDEVINMKGYVDVAIYVDEKLYVYDFKGIPINMEKIDTEYDYTKTASIEWNKGIKQMHGYAEAIRINKHIQPLSNKNIYLILILYSSPYVTPQYLKQNQNTFLVPEIPSNNNGDVDKNFHSGSIAQMGVNFNDTNFDEMLDLLDDIAKFKESPILWNDTKTCDLNDSDDKEQDLTLCNKCDVKISCGYYGKNQLEILKKGE